MMFMLNRFIECYVKVNFSELSKLYNWMLINLICNSDLVCMVLWLLIVKGIMCEYVIF